MNNIEYPTSIAGVMIMYHVKIDDQEKFYKRVKQKAGYRKNSKDVIAEEPEIAKLVVDVVSNLEERGIRQRDAVKYTLKGINYFGEDYNNKFTILEYGGILEEVLSTIRHELMRNIDIVYARIKHLNYLGELITPYAVLNMKIKDFEEAYGANNKQLLMAYPFSEERIFEIEKVNIERRNKKNKEKKI